MARLRPPSGPHPAARLTGDSPAICELRAHIRHLATFDTLGNPQVPTLLIHGETGTGKGLIARIVHDSGPRAQGAFLEVNCAAIPDAMLEAELFGYEAGAFTDAKRPKPGLFEAASGGTLFLDEIDTLPLALQGKLLIAVEEKRVRRLGAVVDRQVDVKLIVATQVDLLAFANAGRFRADLYHRLAVVVLTVPPLRARGDDVIMLAEQFLQRYASAHSLPPKRLSAAAEAWLRQAPWPGNVRELRHLMERVTLLCPDHMLEPTALVQWTTSGITPTKSLQPAPAAPRQEPVDEPARIRQALLQTHGNITRAAQLLGLSRKALRYRLQRYGISKSGLEGFSPPAHPPAGHDPQVSSPLIGSAGEVAVPSLPAPEGQDGGEVSGFHPHPNPPQSRGRGYAGGRGTGSAGTGVPGHATGWEQRTVAVLAIDLTLPHSTRFAISSHEPWRMTSHWEEQLADQIAAFGGVLLRRSPPLLVAGFGLPRALEQMPHRAVQAALAIRRLVEDVQRAVGRDPCPEVRQAIHLGPVLVDTGAPDPVMRLPAVGDTLALPMRLLGHTTPGDVLLSPQAARLVEGAFALQTRGLPLHAGIPGQALAYAVVECRPPQSAERPAVRVRSPFVGRARELAILHEVLRDVVSGRGQVVGIIGEPGMGKSRLLWEFRQQLTDPQIVYVEGRCFASSQGIPYRPILEILCQQCGITEVDPPEMVADKVRGGLQAAGLDPDVGAPPLLHILGITQEIGWGADLTPQAVKARTFDTLVQLSLNAHRRRPHVLALEDIHWIDDTSAEYVTSLVERLAGSPLLLLCTSRPGHQPAWMHKSYATQLTLKPLLPRDSLRVVQAVLRSELLPEALTHAILAKAEGNPFFLEELAQTVTYQGALGLSLELPDTIQGALMARIDALPEAPKLLVQTLAVIGNPCPISLLTRIMDQPVDTLQHLLSTLQRRELLYEQPAMPETTYLLKHALTQDVAYHSLPIERRRALHGCIAQTIEAFYQHRLDEHYGELAHHYQHSGDTPQAVLYLRRAGQQAHQCSATPEAVQHLTTALELLATLPETAARDQQELDMLITLGPALIATKGDAASEVEKVYTRARALCGQVGETPQLLPALQGLWVFYLSRGALSTARVLGEQLLKLAHREAAQTSLLEAHAVLGATLFHLGEYAVARRHLEQGIALTDPAQQQALALRHSLAPGVACLAYAALTLWCLGYPEQAVRRSQEALALAQVLAHPHSLTYAQHWAAQLHHLRREAPAVQAQAEAFLTLATAQALPLWMGMGAFWRGWALATQGQGEVGLAQMHQGLTAVLATGQTLSRPLYLVQLVEAAGYADHVEEGLRLLADALAAFEESERGDGLAEVYRLQGELLLRRTLPDTAQAESCFQQALTIARRQQAMSWEVRAAMSLSRLWQSQGKRDAARELLAPIYAWFTEGFDTADLLEAKALLTALS